MENRALAVQRFDPGEDRRLWEEIQSGEGEARRAIVDLPRIPFGIEILFVLFFSRYQKHVLRTPNKNHSNVSPSSGDSSRWAFGSRRQILSIDVFEVFMMSKMPSWWQEKVARAG
jgi:hypothetical protein